MRNEIDLKLSLYYYMSSFFKNSTLDCSDVAWNVKMQIIMNIAVQFQPLFRLAHQNVTVPF